MKSLIYLSKQKINIELAPNNVSRIKRNCGEKGSCCQNCKYLDCHSSFTLDTQFNPDQIPPNWQLASEHELARQVGIETPAERLNGELNICDCCGYQVQRDPIQLCQDPIILSFLGAGYPMFFQFIRYCIYILILIFAFSGIYNIFSNTKSGDCLSVDDYKNDNATLQKLQKDTKLCFKGAFLDLSIANKKYHSQELFIQQCINCATIFLIIIILQFFRRSQRIINQQADEANVSPSDYTLMLKKIREDPKGPLDYDEELKKLVLLKGIPGQTANVSKVNLCFDLTEIDKDEKLKAAAISKYQEALKYKQKNGQFPDNHDEKYYKDQIAIQENELERLQDVFAEGQTDQFCGTAFVSFNTEAEKDAVYQAHKDKSDLEKIQGLCKHEEITDKDLVFLGGKIKVEEAPEPNDILWLNQGVSTKSKVIRRIISTLVTVVMMVLSFFMILYLNKLQISMSTGQIFIRVYICILDVKKPNFLIEKLMAFLISMAIIIVNVVISIMIVAMSNFEAYSTVTRQNISIAKKNIIAQFFNLAVLTFVVSYYFKENIIGIGGLISNISMIFTTNMIVPPLMHAINISYRMNRFNLWRQKNQGQNSVLTQMQANKLHERPPFQIAVHYSEILKIMFFAVFYAPIIPIGILFSIILLILLYWGHKYNLLRRNCVLNSQSSELAIEMTEMQITQKNKLFQGWNGFV